MQCYEFGVRNKPFSKKARVHFPYSAPWQVPKETVNFVSQESDNVSRGGAEGNIEIQGRSKQLLSVIIMLKP